MELYQIIKRPLVTEKGAEVQAKYNQYFFEVHPKAHKPEIRRAIEKIFKVHVLSVRTLNVYGKYKKVGKNVGRRSDWKKAMVTLKSGDKIELAEGV